MATKYHNLSDYNPEDLPKKEELAVNSLQMSADLELKIMEQKLRAKNL